jgi:hypothetical protein
MRDYSSYGRIFILVHKEIHDVVTHKLYTNAYEYYALASAFSVKCDERLTDDEER